MIISSVNDIRDRDILIYTTLLDIVAMLKFSWRNLFVLIISRIISQFYFTLKCITLVKFGSVVKIVR